MKSSDYSKCVQTESTPRTIDSSVNREPFESPFAPSESQFSRNRRNGHNCYTSAFGSNKYVDEDNSQLNFFLDTQEREGVDTRKKSSFLQKRNQPQHQLIKLLQTNKEKTNVQKILAKQNQSFEESEDSWAQQAEAVNKKRLSQPEPRLKSRILSDSRVTKSLGRFSLLNPRESQKIHQEAGDRIDCAQSFSQEPDLEVCGIETKKYLIKQVPSSVRKSATARVRTSLVFRPSQVATKMTPAQYYVYQKNKYLERYDEALEMAETQAYKAQRGKHRKCILRCKRCMRRCQKHQIKDPFSRPQSLTDIKKPKLSILPEQDRKILIRYFWQSSVSKVRGILMVMRALKLIHSEIYKFGALNLINAKGKLQDDRALQHDKCVGLDNNLANSAEESVQIDLAIHYIRVDLVLSDLRASLNCIYG